jgi:hypothetical protein
MRAPRLVARVLVAPVLITILITMLGTPGCVLAQQSQQPSTAPSNQSAGQKPRPLRKDRVFVWDIQGTWISKPYMEKLQATRSPNAAGQQTPPLVIKVEKEGGSYPILTTNFQKAVLRYLLDIEPLAKPNNYRMVTAEEDRAVSSAEVTYIPFRGQRNAAGKFDALSIADLYFAKRKFVPFVRLPDALEQFVNRLVIAGKYRDESGRTYEFTEAGEAILPDRKFIYDIALDPRAANCDLLESHPERAPDGKEKIGFAWKGRELQLFNLKETNKGRWSCERKPMAVLTPQAAG